MITATRDTEIQRLVAEGYNRDHAIRTVNRWYGEPSPPQPASERETPDLSDETSSADVGTSESATMQPPSAERKAERRARKASQNSEPASLAPTFRAPGETVDEPASESAPAINGQAPKYAEAITAFATAPDKAMRAWYATNGAPLRGRLSGAQVTAFANAITTWHAEQGKPATNREGIITAKAVDAFTKANASVSG